MLHTVYSFASFEIQSYINYNFNCKPQEFCLRQGFFLAVTGYILNNICNYKSLNAFSRFRKSEFYKHSGIADSSFLSISLLFSLLFFLCCFIICFYPLSLVVYALRDAQNWPQPDRQWPIWRVLHRLTTDHRWVARLQLWHLSRAGQQVWGREYNVWRMEWPSQRDHRKGRIDSPERLHTI